MGIGLGEVLGVIALAAFGLCVIVGAVYATVLTIRKWHNR